MKYFTCGVETNGCCGVGEICYFHIGNWNSADGGSYSIKIKNWSHVLNEIIKREKGQVSVLNFWFVKKPRAKNYEFNELMQEVEKRGYQLGTYKNPNTGNYIRGFMIPITKKLA